MTTCLKKNKKNLYGNISENLEIKSKKIIGILGSLKLFNDSKIQYQLKTNSNTKQNQNQIIKKNNNNLKNTRVSISYHKSIKKKYYGSKRLNKKFLDKLDKLDKSENDIKKFIKFNRNLI